MPTISVLIVPATELYQLQCLLTDFIFFSSSDFYIDKMCTYDKDHMSALRIKNTSESDPCSYKVT